MSYQLVIKWGIAISLVMSLLSGCGAATPTPIVILRAPTSTPLPPPVPQPVLPRATAIPATATTGPAGADAAAATPTGGTLTPEPTPTLGAHIDRPFLMRIDRISVIVGRGTLLEGRVSNGTLQENSSVEILGSQNAVFSPTVLAILVANTMRDQVTVGDYAGILVSDIEATDLTPGMLLAETGKYESYEEALRQLQ